MSRKILHVDMDAFFAAVEQLDHPELRGKPVVVGSASDRGVVATASYEARAFGVHSAMSSKIAKKRCPDCIFVRGNFERYREISKMVLEILRTYTDQLEPVSIDEAYLDISHLYVAPTFVAKEIKRKVFEKTQLTISVGISYNKFLAKLASDWNKPDGLFEIKRDQVRDLLSPLPIRKVHGLGKKSEARLNKIGIYTIGDLYAYTPDQLSYYLGQGWAQEIYDRIRGIDDRPVKPHGERKSYGKETTFSEDIVDRAYVREVLHRYATSILDHLERDKKVARTLTVKIKYGDFTQITRSYTLPAYTSNLEEILHALDRVYDKIDLKEGVRLAGVSFSSLSDASAEQVSLLDLL